jgi:hypothetical protein
MWYVVKSCLLLWGRNIHCKLNNLKIKYSGNIRKYICTFSIMIKMYLQSSPCVPALLLWIRAPYGLLSTPCSLDYVGFTVFLLILNMFQVVTISGWRWNKCCVSRDGQTSTVTFIIIIIIIIIIILPVLLLLLFGHWTSTRMVFGEFNEVKS